MPGKKCCFIGQRELQDNIGLLLSTAVGECVAKDGVTEFMVGCCCLFDLIAAGAVELVKERDQKVKMYLMRTGYAEQERIIRNLEEFDAVICPQELADAPRELALSRLYQCMIRDSDFVISYVTHSGDVAAEALEMARERERKGELSIISLGELAST